MTRCYSSVFSPYSCIAALKYVRLFRKEHHEYCSTESILRRFVETCDNPEDNHANVVQFLLQVMGKLGFIFAEVEKGWGFTQSDLGPLDVITPAGWNLVRAETVAAMQECYLRAMVTPLFPCGDGFVGRSLSFWSLSAEDLSLPLTLWKWRLLFRELLRQTD